MHCILLGAFVGGCADCKSTHGMNNMKFFTDVTKVYSDKNPQSVSTVSNYFAFIIMFSVQTS